jgi:malate synthase
MTDPLTLVGSVTDTAPDVLDDTARSLVAALEARSRDRRRDLLRARRELARRVDEGEELAQPEETRSIREDASWQVAPPPEDLRVRQVELATPATAEQARAAASSGADVWVADFEDSLVPTWDRLANGHRVVTEAVTSWDGGPTVVVRPRGLHLVEAHLQLDGEPVGAPVADVGLFLAGAGRALVERGRTPSLYLPKLESHEEAAWWDDLLTAAEELLGLAPNTVRVSILVETVQATYQLEEILHVLRHRVTALAAGRWDYVFSHLRTYATRRSHVLPDLDSFTMNTRFLRAYTDLIVRTCRYRGAQALGGPVTEVPGGPFDDTTLRAQARVRRDKTREARQGFVGAWVLHPAQVPIARQAVAGTAPEEDLPTGLRTNLRASLTYLTGWLAGEGTCVLDGHLHDFGTVELARLQVWQWAHHDVRVAEGPLVGELLLSRMLADEISILRRRIGDDSRVDLAAELLEDALYAEEPPAFLSVRAYEVLLSARERAVPTSAA